jgi:hypothetical protein
LEVRCVAAAATLLGGGIRPRLVKHIRSLILPLPLLLILLVVEA